MHASLLQLPRVVIKKARKLKEASRRVQYFTVFFCVKSKRERERKEKKKKKKRSVLARGVSECNCSVIEHEICSLGTHLYVDTMIFRN